MNLKNVLSVRLKLIHVMSMLGIIWEIFIKDVDKIISKLKSAIKVPLKLIQIIKGHGIIWSFNQFLTKILLL